MLDGTRKQMTEPLTTARRLSIVPFEATGLGDRSYMVHDGDKAAVIDPQRDPVPYVAAAAELNVKIEVVLETHIHNDYVSGGVALARRTEATYGVPAGEAVDFGAESRALAEGDVLTAGSLTFRALWTPGHTPHHLAFLAEDSLGTMAVMTGGSLLAEATGRTDLSGDDRAAELAEAQWHSVRRLLDELPSNTLVLPTHGFGSFCSSGAHGGPDAHTLTVGEERRRNPVARLGLPAFVESLLHQDLPIPAYYRYMAPLNRAGAAEPRPGLPRRFPRTTWPAWSAPVRWSSTYVADEFSLGTTAAGRSISSLALTCQPILVGSCRSWLRSSSCPTRLTKPSRPVTSCRGSGGTARSAGHWPVHCPRRPTSPRSITKPVILPTWPGVPMRDRRPACWTFVSRTNGGAGTCQALATSPSPKLQAPTKRSPETKKSGSIASRVFAPPSPPQYCRVLACSRCWWMICSKTRRHPGSSLSPSRGTSQRFTTWPSRSKPCSNP